MKLPCGKVVCFLVFVVVVVRSAGHGERSKEETLFKQIVSSVEALAGIANKPFFLVALNNTSKPGHQ